MVLAGVRKTDAVRMAMEERLKRLRMDGGTRTRRERVMRIPDQVKLEFPNADYGEKITNAEVEEILGYVSR